MGLSANFENWLTKSALFANFPGNANYAIVSRWKT